MLLVPFIRENREHVIERLQRKNFKNIDLVDVIISLDERRRSLQNQSDTVASEANLIAKQVGELMRAGKKEEAELTKLKSSEYKEQQKTLLEQLAEAEQQLQQALVQLPNLPHASVPAGITPEENEVVHEWGVIPTLYDGAKPHWELTSQYDIIDFELGVKITGAGFPVYKGKGARLQRALINFFLDEAIKAGYSEIMPPLMVNA